MKTNSALFFFLFACIINLVKAADSIGDIFNFTEDVRTIVLQTPGGNPLQDKSFNLTTHQADQIKALADLDNNTRIFIESNNSKKDCDQNKSQNTEAVILEKKIEKRNFEISVSLITNDTKFESNIIGRFMNNDYVNYMNKLSFEGNKFASDIYSLDELEKKYKKNNNADLSKLNFKEKEKLLREYAENYLKVKMPEGLFLKEMAFAEMVNNSSNWKETLAVAKDALTSEQKIELVSKVGGYFGNKYNYTRFKEGDKASGYVNIEQLFNSVKNGTEGGICRDIALAQTQMLRELGFTNNYVVTYKTLSGYHSNVISTDPVSGKVVKFNYDEATSMKSNSGTEAFIQDTTMPDHGLAYRVHDADGKPVTQVPSELGLILKDATGGTNRSFTDSNYSIAKVGVKLGDVDGNLFTGKTSSGDNIYGVAIFKNYDSEYLSVHGGISLSKLSGDRTFLKIDQDNLYARLDTEVRSPTLDFGPITLGGFAGANTEILGYRSVEALKSSNYSKSSKSEFDGKVDGYVGVRSEMRLGSDIVLTNKTYAVFYPDLANVADASKIKVVNDGVYINSGISHAFGKDEAILIESTVMIKNYGTSMGISAAYEDYHNRVRVKGGFEGPMKNDMPTFLPGGSSHAYIGVEKETKSGLIFSIEYDRDLTSNNNSMFLKASKHF